ncbi:MAG TPA: hypothetical protein VLS93_04915 [Anaeromyxobacteraceae bacterium]|nr:hypothetical protein [Anaeromyxobacteraceae bacterium]
MRLTPTTRLVAAALLVFLATAALWWLVGYQIGKGLLEEAGGGGAWRAAFGFRDGGVARLLVLALLGALALGAAGAAQGVARWALVAGLGLGGAFVLGARDGALAGVMLFVLAVAAVDEAAAGAPRLVAALVLGLAVAFAQVLDGPFTVGQGALAVGLRGALFWWPLLAGPHLVEEYVLGARP